MGSAPSHSRPAACLAAGGEGERGATVPEHIDQATARVVERDQDPVELAALPTAPRYSRYVTGDVSQRLEKVASAARAAEARRDDAAVGEAWRRYRLIRDGARDPDELLAEGVELSRQAIELASPVRRRV